MSTTFPGSVVESRAAAKDRPIGPPRAARFVRVDVRVVVRVVVSVLVSVLVAVLVPVVGSGCRGPRGGEPATLALVPGAARATAVADWPALRANPVAARALRADRVEHELAAAGLPAAEIASVALFSLGAGRTGALVAGGFDRAAVTAALRGRDFEPRRISGLDALCGRETDETCVVLLDGGLAAAGPAAVIERIAAARTDSADRFVARSGIAELLARVPAGSAPVRAFAVRGGAGGPHADGIADALDLVGGQEIAAIAAALGSAEALGVALADAPGGRALRVRLEAPLRDAPAAAKAAAGVELLGGLAGALARGRGAKGAKAAETLEGLAAEADGRYLRIGFDLPVRGR